MSSSYATELIDFLAHALSTAESAFYSLPGSAIIERYVRSSHKNDPGRTFLELLLVVFVIRTLLMSRTKSVKNFIDFSEKEINELVDDWTPEPLGHALSPQERTDLDNVHIISGQNGPKPKLVSTGKTAINLASFNFAGLQGIEENKTNAIRTVRDYGTGTCGPSGFYGTIDVHTTLEQEIADFLDTEASIVYAQGFSTVPSVISAFAKRGDVIVADRSVNFAIQKGIQISRSTVRWYDHNDLKSLEHVLQSVAKERRKKKNTDARMFIVTEGIFEQDGALTDLPKLVELKTKYKYRLILDESFSFGTTGRTGRGLTELYNVPASKVDMIIGSLAIGLCAGGGFCAGSAVAIEHQRHNGAAFVFSASLPAFLSTTASECINYLRSSPSVLTTLQENIRATRNILDKVDTISIPSHPASPIIHIQLRSPATNTLHPASAHAGPSKPNNPAQVKPRDMPKWDIEEEEALLQEVVEEALSQGVMITKAKRLRGQELIESRPSIRLAMTAALSKKETEKAINVVKTSLIKILGRRRTSSKSSLLSY